MLMHCKNPGFQFCSKTENGKIYYKNNTATDTFSKAEF